MPDRWTQENVPKNVRLGRGSVITGDYYIGELPFKRFFSRLDPGLVIGEHCTLDGVLFNVGEEGRVLIGDYCYLKDAFLVCEQEIVIGNYVVVGWHASLVDSDFHPIGSAERMADAVALSPLGDGRPRPPYASRPIVIEDDVWIGPNAVILKGVRVGNGAFVEAGAVVVADVPPRARVLGNPAQVIGLV
jgi:acetyltransferase-like isoleucine patch superfamily enzyme